MTDLVQGFFFAADNNVIRYDNLLAAFQDKVEEADAAVRSTVSTKFTATQQANSEVFPAPPKGRQMGLMVKAILVAFAKSLVKASDGSDKIDRVFDGVSYTEFPEELMAECHCRVYDCWDSLVSGEPSSRRLPRAVERGLAPETAAGGAPLVQEPLGPTAAKSNLENVRAHNERLRKVLGALYRYGSKDGQRFKGTLQQGRVHRSGLGGKKHYVIRVLSIFDGLAQAMAVVKRLYAGRDDVLVDYWIIENDPQLTDLVFKRYPEETKACREAIERGTWYTDIKQFSGRSDEVEAKEEGAGSDTDDEAVHELAKAAGKILKDWVAQRAPSLVFMSPPCNDISRVNASGKGVVAGPNSSLFFDAAAVLEKVMVFSNEDNRVPGFFFENVVGLNDDMELISDKLNEVVWGSSTVANPLELVVVDSIAAGPARRRRVYYTNMLLSETALAELQAEPVTPTTLWRDAGLIDAEVEWCSHRVAPCVRSNTVGVSAWELKWLQNQYEKLSAGRFVPGFSLDKIVIVRKEVSADGSVDVSVRPATVPMFCVLMGLPEDYCNDALGPAPSAKRQKELRDALGRSLDGRMVGALLADVVPGDA